MILTVLTSAFQVFCFSVWACLMFFSRLKRGDAPWKRWPQRWTLVLIVLYGCVLGGPCSQHDLHWSEVFLHLLAEAVFARLLYCKVKTSFFFFFCIKSMYVLGSRYLTLFLVVPFFELLSYNKKFLTLGVLAWPGFKTEMCFDPSWGKSEKLLRPQPEAFCLQTVRAMPRGPH